ncbi:hypothetical protein T440DRAFT_519011 [Plenodomus tracheiphilus IPT5]|uniref:Uncharacterized protein n=1 Tax=Plenodomus tracheiphilus IPT5 TaxID=1408161 RepID=A0A6A7B2Q1_9PLEO|nr:hypothetical protein T440DRAFT_519011 [Plenodomus tracheiphilus IPT5]
MGPLLVPEYRGGRHQAPLYPSSNRSAYRGTIPTPPAAPAKTNRRQASNTQPLAQRINSQSTTIYTLCTPRPVERYGDCQYFSAPYIFIPYPPSSSKPRSARVSTARPFPGFRSSESSHRHSSAVSHRAVFETRRDRSAAPLGRNLYPDQAPWDEDEPVPRESTDSSDGLFVPDETDPIDAALLEWTPDDWSDSTDGRGARA